MSAAPDGFAPEEWQGMVEGAREMRKLYLGYVDAGFTDDQALRLVAYVVTSTGMGAAAARGEQAG